MSRRSSLALITAVLAATSVLAGCQREDAAFPPPEDCTVASKNQWLYALMQERYLWNDRVPELDEDAVAGYETPKKLLDALIYAEVDRWSYIRNKQVADDYYDKGRGLSFGYKTAKDDDGNKRISYVNEPSPAFAAGLVRGDIVISSGYLDDDRLLIGLEIEHVNGEMESIELEKEKVLFATVPYENVIDVDNEQYGYLMFRTFVKPSNEALDKVFKLYQALGITKIIIDLRYNGGGLLSVARHFGNLIAGAENEAKLSYTNQHNADLAGEDKSRYYKRVDRSIPVEEVVFITGGGTASASELVINMVTPYVKTTSVGGTTRGKPVGMYGHDFCEDVVNPISFRMVNAEGYGGYYDGMVPDCAATDDLLHPLGDEQEASLVEAITVLRTGACSARASELNPSVSRFAGDASPADDELPAGGAIEVWTGR
ncbi:MAG: S41 family peptidase [Nannocystaceae bacterium]